MKKSLIESEQLIDKVIDVMVFSKLHAIWSTEHRFDRECWLMGITNVIFKELTRQKVAVEKHFYYLHYVLCMLEIHAMTEHPNKKASLDAREDVKLDSVAVQHEAVVALGLCATKLGLEIETIQSCADSVFKDESVKFFGGDYHWYFGLSTNVYWLLSHSWGVAGFYALMMKKGIIPKSSKFNEDNFPSQRDERAWTPLVMLGLFKEFEGVSQCFWHQLVTANTQAESLYPIVNNYHTNESEIHSVYYREYLYLRIFNGEMNCRSGLKIVTDIISGKKAKFDSLYKHLGNKPIDIESIEENFINIAQWVISDFDDDVFVDAPDKDGDKPKKKLFNTSKGRKKSSIRKLSLICATDIYLLQSFDYTKNNKGEDKLRPIYSPGYEQVQSVTRQLSNHLKKSVGITISAKTLYEAHQALVDNIYPIQYERWNVLYAAIELLYLDWFIAQCYLSDYPVEKFTALYESLGIDDNTFLTRCCG
ncbi:TPA: hypothetical protein KD885_003859 [Vibrio parahaemolyticus]|nr:hypothetical protein [Vibrio parahaemolyticus]